MTQTATGSNPVVQKAASDANAIQNAVIEESMGPCYYSCPQKYLGMVPLDQFGGNADWRELVAAYHEQKRSERRARRRAAM